MYQIRAMFWKEWRESAMFLWLGLGIFLGLPILGGFESMWQYSHRFELQTSPWVIMLGGVFALFLAVGLTCRDLQTKIEDFWRSRPMGTFAWFSIKYLVGLLVTLVVCELPLLAEHWVSPKIASPYSAAACIPFLCSAIYSIAFSVGCLLRRPAHAAMVSFAGMLLLLFLPFAIPPLRFLTVMDVMVKTNDFVIDDAMLKYAGGMLGLCVVFLAASLLGVSLGWRVSAGKRLMYGSVAAVVLIMFGASGYQLGTNLPVLAQAQLELPSGKIWANETLRSDGQTGFVRSARYENKDVANNDALMAFRQFRLKGDDLQIEPAKLFSHSNDLIIRQRSCSPNWDPEVFYSVADFGEGSLSDYKLIVNVADGSLPPSRIDLVARKPGKWPRTPSLVIAGNRLFAVGDQVNVFDLTDDVHPKLLSTVDAPPWEMNNKVYISDFVASRKDWVLPLMPIDGLSKEDRFRLALQSLEPNAFDGEFLCVCPYPDRRETAPPMMSAWKLRTLTDNAATFSPVGSYHPSLLEQFFGGDLNNTVTVRDGLAYVWPMYRVYGFVRATVFDLRSAHPLAPAGHFSAPQLQAICPLPDGRALMAGDSLWLVGPPPTRR